MPNIEHPPGWPQVAVTRKLACKQRSQSWEKHILVELLYCANSCATQQQ